MRVKMLKFITLFAVGGTERQFVYLTKELDRSRFDIRVGCLARKGDFLKDIEAMNVPISEYSISSLFSCGSLKRQLRLARDIRRDGIQLVHAYGFYPNLFSIPAARFAGNCITVASVRDTGAFSNRKKIKTVTQRLACQLADCVIANSRAVRDWLVSSGVQPDHIRVIPNGMVLPPRAASRGEFPIRRQLGIDPTAPVVAVVCRLNEGKGLEYFLEATVTVSKEFPAARFLIVGDSIVDATYKRGLECKARNFNVQDRVIFTGQRSDVSKLLEEVNLSVLPSLSEGLSNSLLEAMAAGLPVVATNVGGNPEIVQDGRTGILVPARDPAALSAAMIRILRSPLLARQFGEAGRARVAANFSLETTVRQTEDLYLSLLDDRAWRHAREVRAE
jgi:glycosyltransferase involved in cell wall biosynthesis